MIKLSEQLKFAAKWWQGYLCVIDPDFNVDQRCNDPSTQLDNHV